jgi:hypothetical protein
LRRAGKIPEPTIARRAAAARPLAPASAAAAGGIRSEKDDRKTFKTFKPFLPGRKRSNGSKDCFAPIVRIFTIQAV